MSFRLARCIVRILAALPLIGKFNNMGFHPCVYPFGIYVHFRQNIRSASTVASRSQKPTNKYPGAELFPEKDVPAEAIILTESLQLALYFLFFSSSPSLYEFLSYILFLQ